jgi:hypothetical protein
MEPSRTRQFTIRQFMVVVAVAACLLAFPRLVAALEPLAAASLAMLLAALVLLHVLVGQVFGWPCPVCSRWALRRLARHRWYYRCSACRARLKRIRFGPWLDAYSPEDAWRYKKPTDAGTWKGFEVPGNLAGSTSGRLLEQKRSTPVLDEKKRRPPYPPEPNPRLEEAKLKVRKFLKHMHEMDE